MDFSETINDIVYYLQGNIYVSLGLGLVLLLLIFRKPKLFITIFVITFLLISIILMINIATDTGDEHREETAKKEILKD